MWKFAAYTAGMIAATGIASGATAQTPIPPSPKDFVMGASQSDQYEILAARTAVAQSRDHQVVSFAQMMIRDHMRLSADLRAATQASRLPAPDPGMSSDQAGMLSGLQSLRGTDFDKAYAKQQILAHTQALAVETSFATSGADANLQKAARSALPTIEEHLKMARQLAQDVGAP
jgi:putative membrane protein